MSRTLFYLIFASIWFWGLLLLSRHAADTGSLAYAVLAALLVLLPSLGATLYLQTVRIIRTAHVYAEATILKRLMTSRILSTLLLGSWTLGLSFLAVFWLATLPEGDVYLLFIAVMVFYFLRQLLIPLAAASVKAFFANALSLGLARHSGAAGVTLGFVLIAMVSEQPANPGTLGAVFADLAASEPVEGGTILVYLLVKLFSYMQAAQAYGVAQLGAGGLLSTLVALVVTYSLVHQFLGVFSGLLIPPAEYRRILTPVEDIDIPASVPLTTRLVVPAVSVILLALLVSLLAQWELRLYRDYHNQRSGQLQPIVSSVEARAGQYAELLDGVAYREGTVAEIEQLLVERNQQYQQVISALESAGDAAFDAMRDNVDVYLDNYYSLSAEYLRILATLSGSLEQRIADELRDTLLDSERVAELNAEITAVAGKLETINREYDIRIADVLQANRIETSAMLFPASTDSLAQLTRPEDAILGLDLRLSAAAGGGLLTTAIVMGIIQKATAKGIFAAWSKVFLKSVSKFLPAIVPAALVAFIPGVGPLIISVLIGTVGTLLIDKAALELEEAYSRDKFRAQIIAVIDEQQREFNRLLSGE